jgi:tRNA(Ile)-lysidine synthase
MADVLSQFRVSCLPLGLPRQQPVLLAVSGGVDSVVLLHLFRTCGWPFAVGHCNFGLRGAESDADAELVRQLAQAADAAFYSIQFDTEQFAAEHRLSIQVAARQLRYNWLSQMCQQQDFAGIVTGHHLDDSIETVLLNWTRGTGLKGLTGIPALGQWGEAETPVFRPLLSLSKQDLTDFAQLHRLHWRDDSSNATDHYDRNFLRHQVIPALTTLNPAFNRSAARTTQILNDTYLNYQHLLQQHLQWVERSPSLFALAKQLLQQLPAPAAALYDSISPWGFTPEQARQVLEHLDESGLELSSDQGVRLWVDRSSIFLSTDPKQAADSAPAVWLQEDDLMRRLPDGSTLFLTETPVAPPFPDGRLAIAVDREKLQFPLALRVWQSGDVFQPIGMGGQHQRVQDFLSDRKVSLPERDRTWLLVNGDGRVIWVMGWRPAEGFKIVKATDKALKISWLVP